MSALRVPLTDHDKRKVRLSKIKVAKRQLDCALELWFHDGDEASIHTLLAASYQVISDLNKHRKTSHDDMYTVGMVRPEFQEEWRRVVRGTANFFKHADKDPEGTLDFFPVTNTMFMLYAITGLMALGEQPSLNLRMLAVWFYLHEPRFMSPSGIKLFQDNVPIEDAMKLWPLSKKEFFKRMRNAAAEHMLAGHRRR